MSRGFSCVSKDGWKKGSSCFASLESLKRISLYFSGISTDAEGSSVNVNAAVWLKVFYFSSGSGQPLLCPVLLNLFQKLRGLFSLDVTES